MSFEGKNGFFGKLPKPYTGSYHPSVYARGGGAALGTLGKAFAYKKPQLANGGNIDPATFAQGGNVVTGNDVLPRYDRKPQNGASNDIGSGYQSARGSNDYSWGKVSPRFQNNGAELHPQGRGEVKRRAGTLNDDYLSPAQRRAYEAHERFRRGGAAKMSPAAAWQSKSPALKQRLARGSGPKIHVPHGGAGSVLAIHLGPVGDDAIDPANGGRVWRP
jgi:hypothetical protein